jgi:hypothetical protein
MRAKPEFPPGTCFWLNYFKQLIKIEHFMKNFLLVLVFGLLVGGAAMGYAHFYYRGEGDRGSGEPGSTIQKSGLVSEPAGMILLGLGLIGLAGFGKSRSKNGS